MPSKRTLTIAVVVISCLIFLSDSKRMIPSVNEFFPQLHGDLTQIEWEHATNTQALLQAALDNPAILMLEADVILGNLNNDTEIIPVMGHPPANKSDLSLEGFLGAVIDYQAKGKKGIKLDFKSDDVYNASWSILDKLKDKLTFPVWINSDIIAGPVDPTTTPLNPETFLSLAASHLPEASLSLGWTTNFHLNGKYSAEQLDNMLKAVEAAKVVQPVTLAVRAAYAANSAEGLVDLVNAIDRLQSSNTTSLTIWMSSVTDIVSIQKLRSLILELGRDRSALDVPKRIRDALNLNGDPSPVTVAKRALGTVLTSVTTAFQHLINK